MGVKMRGDLYLEISGRAALAASYRELEEREVLARRESSGAVKSSDQPSRKQQPSSQSAVWWYDIVLSYT